jgi:hypothetical protein
LTSFPRVQRLLIAAACVAALAAAPLAGQSPATVERAREIVVALSSERLGGRLAGSEGERMAAGILIANLKRIGAAPLPGRSDYRFPFEFTAGARDGGSSLVITAGGSPRRFAGPNAIQALSFTDDAAVTGPAVFAGYGLVVPDTQGFSYDSYAGLDVTDKVVVVLRYYPEDAAADVKAVLARYAGLRYKAMAARERGAKALVVVTGPRSPNAGQTVPMTFDTALAGSGIVAVSVNGDAGTALFRGAPQTLAEAQRALDSGNPHVAGFVLPGVTTTVTGRVRRERRTAYNILAYLPATEGQAATRPWVAIGAHYDHLGRGDHGNSLGGDADAGRVHAGADDNASGSAAVLAAAARLAEPPRRRHVLIAFWSAEELGLVGSSAFVASPPFPIDRMAAYLNFDMVGRMRDNKLSVQATGSSPAWPRLIEQTNVVAGFDLQVQSDPYLPTDSASFNQAEVPTLSFFTGTHADYHRPTDTAAAIAYEDLDRVAAFGADLARRIANADEPPAFARVERPAAPAGARSGLRLFTGTIPDYSTETKGLLLSGVIAGGPAEQAGLTGGDVIIEIAGRSIANIYDYTYALDVLKVGEPTRVIYLRKGERRETTLTPTARR